MRFATRNINITVLQNDYCRHYVACEQRLEWEQRQCLRLQNHAEIHHKADCLRQIDEAKSALGGLRLRKTELEKDCAVKSRGIESPNLKYLEVLYFLSVQIPKKYRTSFKTQAGTHQASRCDHMFLHQT
ncbi:unnamed protein product [Gongylonema pulchrum]|uniref:Tektin n=1 Tax=Gongylonema pulchrum TaxID=637853 RepID=A0A183E9M9_9BILA|nr:unnamed protein product [Gongylonema pulchrum]